MKKYKLLLINPIHEHYGLGADAHSRLQPLSLAYVAACTPANYDIRIVDEAFV